jgi:hypothetical protein
MTDDVTASSLMLWAHRELKHRPEIQDELEVTVHADNPAEARRILESLQLSFKEFLHVEEFLVRWEHAAASRHHVPAA